MPKRTTKTKYTTKKRVARNKPVARRQPAKRRRSSPKKTAVSVSPRAGTSKPAVATAKRHPYRVRFMSLLLLLAASLTNSAVVYASGQDIRRSEHVAWSARADLMQPKEYLYRQAEIYGLDFNRLAAIAKCESGWRMVKNKQSSAYGFFQIIDGTERYTPQYRAGGRKFDPFTNIDMAVYLYDRYGASPWFESQKCWKHID